MKTVKIMSIVLVAAIILGLCGCTLNDPTIETEGESTTSSSTAKAEKEIPDYIDIDKFANCSYELSYLLKQTDFNSPDEMSVSALVQFCFCHLYYEYLVDMPTQGVNMRECSLDQMKTIVIKYFGSVDLDLTQADLWNAESEQFEMWEPLYGSSIYYEASAKAMAGTQYRITTTFYSESEKETPIFRTQMTVQDASGVVTIQGLKTIELSSTTEDGTAESN